MDTKYTKSNGELATKLYEISKDHPKSQKDQARDMRYMPTELYNLFHGQRIMKIQDAERIADYLGYRVELVKKGENNDD